MKQFNLIKSRHEMEFSWGKIHVIALGERGRGRKLEIVPMASNISENDTVMLAETRSGKQKIIAGGDNNGWLARINTEYSYCRGTVGCVYIKDKDKKGVKVIAKGYGAYGAAGRIGTFYDYLLQIPDNTWVFVKRSGTSNHRLLYFSSEKVYEIQPDELSIFCENMDLDCPYPPDDDFRKVENIISI